MRILAFLLLILSADAFTIVQRETRTASTTRRWTSPDTMHDGVLEPIVPIHDTRQWTKAPTAAAPAGSIVVQGTRTSIVHRTTPPPYPELMRGQKFIIDTPKMNKQVKKETNGGHRTPPLISTIKDGKVGIQGGAPATSNLHYPGDQAKTDAMEPFCIALKEQSFY